MSAHVSQSDLAEMYGLQYQLDSISDERAPSWAHVAGILATYFEPKTHLDVGAGAGPLVRAMGSLGVESYGIEGSPYGSVVGGPRIVTRDLRRPALHGEFAPGYDLVTCFDTAEHVEGGGHVVDICVEAARDWIVFGAAGPNQEGHGHVFLQPPEYWTAAFEARGFVEEVPLTALMKKLIEAKTIHNKIWWVHRNLHVYHRTAA